MKRAMSLIICAALLLIILGGCTTLEYDSETGEYDDGAIIPVYLGTEQYNFDPGTAYTNDSMAKILSLLYVGLTSIDDNGKLELTLIDSYEIVDGNRDGEYKMTITLKDTSWSDGRAVQASDVVYAWKRLLDVDYDSEAACLLYDIKNAYAAKQGDASIDDVGITAPETLVVEIEFEESIDYTQFLRNLSSPALVPLREDIVTQTDDWAKKASTIVTSGPFQIKSVTYGEVLRLERSSYYFLDSEKNEYADKYVIPYRLETDYSLTLTQQLTAYVNNEIFYINEIPLSYRQSMLDQGYVTVEDEMSTHCYYFNMYNELFQNEKVRQALSAAIDREYIASSIVVFAKAATGFIPYGVTDGSVGTSFRDDVGTLIETTANLTEAQALLDESGINPSDYSFTIRYRAEDDVSAAIAEYTAEVWSSLGFTVTARSVSARQNSEDSTIYNDVFEQYYTVESAQSGQWDVLAIDYQMLSEEAWSALAPFATTFSGNGVELTSSTTDEEYPVTGHVTGYSSEEYDAIIEAAYAEKDSAKRAEILHEAEALLCEDLPIIPVIFNQNAYMYSSVLSGFESNYYSIVSFNRVKMDDYMTWKVLFDTTEASTEEE